jgi:hypothetical protein
MFEELSKNLLLQVNEWENKFQQLTNEQISVPRNKQNRNIKQIVGHMIDSASNNLHRTVLLQYQKLPLRYHNYATYGNNEKWIQIQNYEEINWENLIQIWKFQHIHFLHVVSNIQPENLQNEWIADFKEKITLKGMIEDFPRHFKLHLSEIEELSN